MVTSSPCVGVLALQGDVHEHVVALEQSGAIVRIIRRESELEGIDGLVIPGGESTAISNLLVSFKLVDPLRKLIAEGLPTWGTCAGMVLLADRIEGGRSDQVSLQGLDVTVERNAFGSQVQSFEEELNFKGLERPYTAVLIRAPAVIQLGPEVEVLATSQRLTLEGVQAPVAVSSGKVLATSFHPEVAGDQRIHEFFVREFVS